jgi:hypothetical protein
MKYSLLALGILATTFGLASCLPFGLPSLPEVPELPEVEVPEVEVPKIEAPAVEIPVVPFQ